MVGLLGRRIGSLSANPTLGSNPLNAVKSDWRLGLDLTRGMLSVVRMAFLGSVVSSSWAAWSPVSHIRADTARESPC